MIIVFDRYFDNPDACDMTEGDFRFRLANKLCCAVVTGLVSSGISSLSRIDSTDPVLRFNGIDLGTVFIFVISLRK